MSANQIPSIEPAKEVRFSVVMYGGVSLAIYINGVAQELFHLARATAAVSEVEGERLTAIPGDTISGSERVYRKLSYLLSDVSLLEQYRSYVATHPDVPGTGNGNMAGPVAETALEDSTDPLESTTNAGLPITTRFIVDVLSGTSAGGINAIYLAKAFANNLQIDQLKNLWVNEGDLGVLLNDKYSLAGTGLLNQTPPQSLLNSRRMYAKLLKSLNDMDVSQSAPDKSKSPFVDELDLFITATDIEGVPVPLRLADSVVYERRHRNVFHFKYGKAEVVGNDFNDFKNNYNPFLAFAARCTSSFPFAFEPMRLCDINEVIEAAGGSLSGCELDSRLWQRFFQEEIDPRTGNPIEPPRFAYRSFGDGGYLDNKPFSYATDTLIHRHAEVPVDRKLIYVEPSPEHPEDNSGPLTKPNALQNVKAAILDLPSYETIREDLQRILERNQLIARVNRIISGIEQDVNNYIPYAVRSDELRPSPPRKLTNTISTDSATAKPAEDQSLVWSRKDLAEMVVTFGRYILPYRRLRVSSVTDDIAKLIARLTNFDEDSDQFLAIRCLVRAWREENYVDYKTREDEDTVNTFLWKFDFSYRLRRLNFTRSKLDQLTRLDATFVNELKSFSANLETIKKAANENDVKTIAERHPQAWLLYHGDRLLAFTSQPSAEFYAVLRFIKCELNEVFRDLRTRARLLRSRRQLQSNDGTTSVNPLLEHIRNLDITPADLNEILGVSPGDDSRLATVGKQDPNEDDCFARAKAFLDESGSQTNQALKDTADALGDSLGRGFAAARAYCRTLFDLEAIPTPISQTGTALMAANEHLLSSEMAKSIRGFLGYYFRNFDEYDQISFPIFYETEVGEGDIIEVIRISPEDATSLINERQEMRNSPDPAQARQKLAGVALHHFGAFLDRSWRENDIMWGRLDGAERLISALLPGLENSEIRQQLTREANLSILKEELRPESVRALQSVIVESLINAGAGMPLNVAIEKTLGPLKDSTQKRQLEKIITLSIGDDELLEFMSKSYEVNRQLDPKSMLTSISRATQIIGGMFEEMANESGLDGKHLNWIAQLGRVFWGLVEVAVPNSILNKLVTHWLYLIYLFEVVTILGGVFLARAGAQQFGWTALGITAFLNIVMLLLKDKMRGRHPVRSVLTFFTVTFISILLLVGSLKALGIFGLRVGAHELTPLSWLAQFVYRGLDLLGPLGRPLPLLGLLIILILVVMVLNFVGSETFDWFERWRSRSVEDGGKFVFVKLEPFKKDDMTNVRVSQEAGIVTYTILSRLSNQPTPNWIQRFDNNWSKLDQMNQARIYSEVLSFTTSAEKLPDVWQKLQEAVAQTNTQCSADFEAQKQELAALHDAQRRRLKKELDEKWHRMKSLT